MSKILLIVIIGLLISLFISFKNSPFTSYPYFPTELDVINAFHCTPIAPSLNKDLFVTLGYRVCPF